MAAAAVICVGTATTTAAATPTATSSACDRRAAYRQRCDSRRFEEEEHEGKALQHQNNLSAMPALAVWRAHVGGTVINKVRMYRTQRLQVLRHSSGMNCIVTLNFPCEMKTLPVKWHRDCKSCPEWQR